MPELPEVEVVKLFLENRLLHHTITNIDILNAKSFIGNPKKVINQKIVKFTRTGKQLSIHLSNKLILLVHLKMTGQLILGSTMLGHPTKFEKYPNKSTRIIFQFRPPSSRGEPKEQGVLFFNDQRKFGWVKLLTNAELVEAQSNLGHDIFDEKFTSEYLFLTLQRSKAPIKTVLLNQNLFAGIGNIYANDALFLSNIHPSTPSNKISRTKALKLYHSLLDIMRQSVLAGGSTMKDNKYVRPDGSFGENQFLFRVYQRKGKPCLVCRMPIESLKIGGRGTFFCPKCQKPSV